VTPIPVTIVGGYLGAGKTTLVNHLLRHAQGRRLAVLVNDFGDIAIDAELIESREGNVLNLAGGCVCCSVGSDLVGALMALPGWAAPPDHCVIETSGVALPGAVARTLTLVQGVRLDGVVVLADAETVRARAADRYVGDTVRGQLRDADLVLLNKVDLVAGDEVAALHAWLGEAAPRAPVVDAVDAAVPVEVVLELGADAVRTRGTGELFAGDAASRRLARRGRASAGDVFVARSFRLDAPVDPTALARDLASSDIGIVRAKGIVADADGRWFALQVVGRRHTVTAFEPRPDAAAGTGGAGSDRRGSLVCIATRRSFDERRLLDLLIARGIDVGTAG
jgi:G3E family GTPase